jgi:CubicO group peptidase (beta-lactamase class C family)
VSDGRPSGLAVLGQVLGVVLGVLLIGGLGLYSFISTVSTPLHPTAPAVPSAQLTAPLPAWAGAVTQGQEIARAAVREQNLPGLSVAIGVEGAMVWAEGFGWADLEKQVPVAPDTRFRVGHASKAVTSAAVGLLLEERRLDLRDDIQTYVPEFPRKQWPITLRQLMGNTSGIRHYTSESDYMPTGRCERASESLRSFANDPLRFEPETRYGYSTFGWILVSAAVEAVAGEPFFTFMRTRIFDPLGMSSTAPDAGSASLPNRTTFYSDGIFGLELAKSVDYSCFAGASGFLSTPSDLVRFGLGLASDRLLKRDTVRRLQSRQYLVSGQETGYGLGWMLGTDSLAGKPARWAGHSSRTPLGGSTSFLIFADREVVVAVMANVTNKDMRSIALRIAQAFAEGGKGSAVTEERHEPAGSAPR